MRKWLLATVGLIVLPAIPALAQTPIQAQVVPACATPQSTYVAGTTRPVTQDTTGSACVAASVSASTTATASATPTPVLAGTGKPLNIDLFSELFVQPAFGGQVVDLTHGLPVNIVAGAGAGGTSLADEGAFVAGTTAFTPSGGFFQTTATSNPLTNGQGGWAQMTSTRSLFMNLRNNAGAETGVAAVPLQVSLANTGANATPVSVAGTGTAGTANAGVVTVQGIASMTKLLVTPDSVALPANQSVNVAQIGGTNTVNGGVAGSQSVGGTVATNVAITANPMNLGAQAVSSENSAVTTARQVQLVADLVGKLIVLPYANPENFVSGVTAAMTATTSTSVIAAPASGLRNYITQCTFSNSHATVGTMMNLQDGSGGTTIYSFPAAAVYGGATVSFPTPLRQPTTATALFVVNATTGANTFAACSGYKGA